MKQAIINSSSVSHLAYVGVVTWRQRNISATNGIVAKQASSESNNNISAGGGRRHGAAAKISKAKRMALSGGMWRMAA